MRERIIRHLRISSIITIVVYILSTFVFWDFINPIEVLSNLSDLKDVERFLVLTSYIIYHLFIFGFTTMIKEEL